MPRNSSGIYTLPGGNPVTPGDVIEAAWANTTMEDVADALTNSLSRTGAGGMLAPFRIADGSVSGPGLSFLNETNSGLYRQSAGQVWMAVTGVNVLQYTANGVLIPVGKTLTAQGNISATTLDVSTSAEIELATLTGNTKLGKGTGTESLRVVPAALAVNWLRIYGGALGAGPTIDAQGSDNNINLNLAAKGTGSIVAASPVTLSSTLSVTGAITVTGGVTGPVTSSNAVITGGTINNVVIGGSTPQTITGTTITSTVGFVGGLTGNVTGNLTGNVTGNVTGGVTGNVTGSLTGNVTAASGTSTFENVTINGSLDMNSATGSTITGLSTPTADSDAANKAYVDSVAQGIDAKASCLVATTGNITLSGTQTIDGVAVTAGQRVLVWQQSTSSQNGIYVSAAGAWSRSTDCDTWAELVSAYTFIEQGTANGNNGYICTVQSGGTLGVTPVTWVQFSGAGQINAGAGLSKTGNTLNVGTASSTRIVVNTDDIDLAATGITPGTYKSLTIDAYGRATGGTNPTTLSGYGITDAYTIAQVDALFGSTTSAAASAAAAATSASNAATSATNAANSATASAGSATSAAATYTNFNNQYLGSKSSDPTVNNTGGALVAGNLYWNTTASEMRVYTGSAWLTAYLPATGYLALTGGTLTGNLNFSGTGLRITGDFSNATMLSRTLFQSNTANGNTQVGAIPNGTSVNSAFFTYNNSDPTNASTGILRTNGSEVAVLSGITGTGTYLPLTFWTSNLERGRVSTAGNWLLGGTTDNATDKLQVTGSMSLSSALRVGASPSAGTAGQVLTSAGAGAAPTWSAPPASAGTVTAVASGSLSDGTKVILNSDGTVSAVAATAGTCTTAIGATVTGIAYVGVNYVASSYDASTSTVVIYWIDNSSYYLWGLAGTVTGSAITFGSATTIFSANVGGYNSWGFGAVYVPSVNRHVLAFTRNSDGYTVLRSIYTTNTSITVTAANATAFTGTCFSTQIIYDSINDKVVIAGWSQDIFYTRAVVATVAASSFTVGATVNAFQNASGFRTRVGLTQDTVNNKIIVGAIFGPSDYPTVAVGTVSGTSISFGSAVAIESVVAQDNTLCFSLGYSVVDQKVFAAYALGGGGYPNIRGAVGTVSGTSISFGSPSNFSIAKATTPYSLVYYAITSKLVLAAGSYWSNIAISGTSFTESNTSTGFSTTSGYNGSVGVYLSNFNWILTSGYNGGSNPGATTSYGYTTNLTSINFLGISNAAYTNGQTATIQTVGSTDDAQSGLTPGLKYYVDASGALSSAQTTQPYAGLALSATKLVIKG